MVATKALTSITLPRPLRTKIQPIRMRAISSNVSEVLAARLSVYDSVGCDDAATDCILMVALPFRFPVAGANASRRRARRSYSVDNESAAPPITSVKLSRTGPLLSANSVLTRCSKKAPLFDPLVGAREPPSPIHPRNAAVDHCTATITFSACRQADPDSVREVMMFLDACFAPLAIPGASSQFFLVAPDSKPNRPAK